MKKKLVFGTCLMLELFSGLLAPVASAAEIGAPGVTPFEQARALFQAAEISINPARLALGHTWECVLTQANGGRAFTTSEQLRFVAVGRGNTMLVNDAPLGNREYTGNVWMSSGYGYESKDSEGFSCRVGEHKTVDYYKRALRMTSSGEIIIERMTSSEGACVPNVAPLVTPGGNEMNYPQAIADGGYLAQQYFVCHVSQD